jgi:hypothetical protein
MEGEKVTKKSGFWSEDEGSRVDPGLDFKVDGRIWKIPLDMLYKCITGI